MGFGGLEMTSVASENERAETMMAEETGIVFPYETDAMAGLEMPNGLSYPDQVLYLELRLLYRQYYQKIIDRETAVKEKKKMIEQYKDLKFREKMGDHWVEIIRLTELATSEYRKNPCHENAMKLVRILEGRKQ